MPAGRPKAKIDLTQVEALSKLQCTDAELAAFFGVCVATIENHRRRNKKFREACERGKRAGLLSLRRAQMKAALGGNPTMMIWLGKQLLKQRDEKHLEATVKKSISDFTDEELAILAAAGGDDGNDSDGGTLS